MADRIQLRRDTLANWTSVNPTPAQGEFCVELNDLATTPKFKIGDGTTPYLSLPYLSTAVWGNITGLLSDQTDLQNALDDLESLALAI